MEVNLAMQELTWRDVRHRFHETNPTLAALIDELDPDDSHTLFLAKYPYGAEILKNGKLYFPTDDNRLLPFDSSDVSDNIKQKLGYVMGTNPMTFVLQNTIELLISLENRSIPFGFFEPGTLFGVWGVLEHVKEKVLFYTPIPLWDMTAGARSIFMLPKISQNNAFNKLQKKYDIHADPPKYLSEHWGVFKQLAQSANFEQEWETEVVYFSKAWVDSMHDFAWHKFKTHIISSAWKGAEFWRSQFCWDLTLTNIHECRGIKPDPYVADVANHLLTMSVGAVPSFAPTLDDSVAPVTELMRIFTEEYGVQYAPIIIGPTNYSVFNREDKRSVYYSFQYETAIKVSAKSSSRSSIVTDMYNVRSLLNKYLEDIMNSDLCIEGTALYEMAKLAQFKFYHYTADNDTKMLPASDILTTDPDFVAAQAACETQEMPKNAPFLNGCVQISNRNHN